MAGELRGTISRLCAYYLLHAKRGNEPLDPVARFHLANGLISVMSNLIWMRIFTGWLGVPPIPANLMAIALTSVVNFLFSERWVFQNRSV